MKEKDTVAHHRIAPMLVRGRRTCRFSECRRWHYYGHQPDEHISPYIRGLFDLL